MATGSGIRKKLETEYLAQSLQGHIQYYATSYSRSPDHEGRAAIRYDGNEIIKGCYWNNWMKADLFPGDEKYKKRMEAHRIIGTIYGRQAEYGKNDNPNLVPAGEEFGLSFYFYCETAKRTMAKGLRPFCYNFR